MESVYQDAWITPIEKARIEAWDGIRVRGYRAWMIASSGVRLIPRFESDYLEIDCDRPVAFFSGLGVSINPALNPATISCFELVNPKLGYENGRWLIEDHANGRYLFRAWKQG